tara:strand:- start:4 stop:249 length:246 start_codon:yes stop_codon:yes gene_type:complete
MVKRTKRKGSSKMSKKAARRVTKKAAKRTKRKGTKRKGKKSTAWNKHMMAFYKSMKAKDPSYKLQNAMKDAKKTYKKGATV